jgi:uncharacterized lipoprotein YajG
MHVIHTQRPLILALMLFALTGCNMTPHSQWATQRDILTTSQNAIMTMHTANLINDDDVKKIQPYLLVAREHLKLAKEELPAGLNSAFMDKTIFDRYMKHAMNAILTVDQFLAERQSNGPSISN